MVENLNSVLDNNKLLTLPNGERLAIPPNVRIMFEVENLKHATPATVSRCGMVWFSEDVLTTDMIFRHYLGRLRHVPLEEGDDGKAAPAVGVSGHEEATCSAGLQLQRHVATLLQPHMSADGLVVRCMEFARSLEHIMDFTRLRALSSLFSMLNQACRNLIQYNVQHSDFPLTSEQLEMYVPKALVYAILWSFSGDGRLKIRDELGSFIANSTTVTLPPNQSRIIDYEVEIDGQWIPWSSRVPKIEVETHMVAAPDVVVPTIDTVRHEALLYTWLADHKPLVLCGPPGSGKTMTLFSALRALPDFEVVGLNFSSATTPELMFKTFDHYCEYRKTPAGVVLAPIQLGKWLVIFCDEINLPDMDNYGTQRVISFLRQLVERGGFYRRSDHTWVQLERIQFVGACNPPTDPGRKPLSHRFLRHVPVVYVDYPGELSLKQIYGTFVRAMLRVQPSLKPYSDPLTSAMVEFYLESQSRFTQDMQPHYVYSPREMTRWVRGICEALRPLEAPAVEALVRLWAHEALRLFHDRLVYDEERQWTNDQINSVASKHFPNVDCQRALERPILYSNWLHRDYVPVEQSELRDYVKARLKVFYEEELDVPLVLFNEVLDHVLRIDRIYRQPQGHLLLIGVSGAGKTTLSRFVAWMNGLSVFQIKVHNKYSGEDFDEDLRMVLRRSGCKGEKLCFILDESNMLDSGFLERMNTLLANGEVPGLFDGDEFSALMTQCKEGSQRDGLMLDSNEELYKWFTSQVIRNLHVVFTMNPSSEGLKDRAATSPALFNRCVLNWFGDWSNGAYFQVGKEFTVRMDLERGEWHPPDYFPVAYDGLPQPPTHRDAIINAFVHIHCSLHSANQRLIKRGQRCTVITPRHYLDFINHFVKLYMEKCADLEEQQLHLNVGLGKIAETVEQVEEMQRSLADKSRELQAKNDAANQKLKQMVVDQQEAERQKVQSQEIQQQLEVQTAEIAVKREDVLADLSQVEPAVVDAQNAVKSIKKQHLVELRTMANPPMLVRLALESICLFLGEETSDWKTIRYVIMKDNFIPSIVNYSTEDISDDIREKLRKRYFSNPDYSYEKINKASSACGPMVKWAIAQINFADMLKRVEPLRNELNSLESQAEGNKKKAKDISELIERLEKSISNYKEEYAVLIAQAQAIKSDLSSVQAKVDRSMALLKSLSIERERWLNTSETFRTQMVTILGDVLLSAAFLAYAGYFDQQLRHSLFTNWCCHLQQAGIQYRGELSRTEYLSTADQRLRWQASALPADDLCTENAIMLHRFNRYPLIIDPSGQAAQFIVNEYADRKITKTSFLDDNFRKNLESALRFGNPLLVQDVENYDPILNPVLNRELRRTGGRVLITIGDQDIDLSPTFTIFLCTRDPTVEFPADICSRVTFVNFTVTRASLQSQCLNQVLKAERPDIDEKRSDMLKLQGEFRLRLRHLEKSLLQALNDSKGKILDDDSVIATLETLKREASEISAKVEETDAMIAEIETVSQQYLPLAHACSSIYFTLESLHQVHYLYQFSLHFFLDVFTCVLRRAAQLAADEAGDSAARLDKITGWLFGTCYTRVARGMLHADCLTLALLLARIRLRGQFGANAFDAEFEFLLRGKEQVTTSGGKAGANTSVSSVGGEAGLSGEQVQCMSALSQCVPAFTDMTSRVSGGGDFSAWLQSDSAELSVPTLWRVDTDEQCAAGDALRQLLVLRCFRPDRVVAGARRLVSAVLGENFLADAETQLQLGDVVRHEVQPCSPVLLCAVHGYDASGRVDDLAAELGCGLTSIAIGSAEGFNQSERAINSAVKTGRWVMLKNVHLAPGWLVQLEKKLHALRPHQAFRLFLTMEITPRLPVNLLRAGRVLVFEPPPGIRANLLRTFSAVGASRMMRAPSERARIYFLLAWFHAVVQERVRYAPLGWSKPYEFTESDLRVACDTLDTWIDSTALGRTNLPPEKVPWPALHTLLTQCVYGGKVDNEFDQRLLSSLLGRLFNPGSFDVDFALVEPGIGGGGGGAVGGRVLMPEGIRRDQFLQWVERLSDVQSPTWLGLPANAERILLATRAQHVLASMLRVQLLEEDDDEAVYSGGAGGEEKQASAASGRPAWMRSLHTNATGWREALPGQLQPLRRSVENIRDPLYRFFEREVNIGARLLADVGSDLDDVVAVCGGTKKQTNRLRVMVSDLVRGQIPVSWRRYSVPPSATVMQFIADFAARARQLHMLSETVSREGAVALRSRHVWLGGLFNPEAYVTATRQCVAQSNGWSLEELTLKVCVSGSDAPVEPGAVAVRGVCLQGATCHDNQLQLGSAELFELELLQLNWVRSSTTTSADAPADSELINLPVYLDSTRSELLFTIDMRVMSGQSGYGFYQRGVALIASTALN